jgi:hypothetical protein
MTKGRVVVVRSSRQGNANRIFGEPISIAVYRQD